MREFSWVSGQLTEVQRFINVPMRWCEQYPARERRELWVTTPEGEDFKFVVHTRAMPARRGHRVVAVLHAGRLVALHNLSTGEGVNFARTDPALLWRRCDGAALAFLFAAGAVACVSGCVRTGLAAATTALLYGPFLIAGRWLARNTFARATGQAIESAQRQAKGVPRLRLVK